MGDQDRQDHPDGLVNGGDVYRSPQTHMDDDGRLYRVVAVDGDVITIDDHIKLTSNGEVRQRGARRRQLTRHRLANGRWQRVRHQAAPEFTATPNGGPS